MFRIFVGEKFGGWPNWQMSIKDSVNLNDKTLAICKQFTEALSCQCF